MARLSSALRNVCVLPFLTIAAPALAGGGRLGGGGALNISLTRIVLALVLCSMVAFLAALLIKKNGGKLDLKSFRAMVIRSPATARRIEVIETRRVSQYADVCLLRCDGQEYLILCAANQQTVLREAPASGEAS